MTPIAYEQNNDASCVAKIIDGAKEAKNFLQKHYIIALISAVAFATLTVFSSMILVSAAFAAILITPPPIGALIIFYVALAAIPILTFASATSLLAAMSGVCKRL